MTGMQTKPTGPRVAKIELKLASLILFVVLAYAALAGTGLSSSAARAAGGSSIKTCGELSATDLSVIGGKGSRVTGAAEAVVDGAAVCVVEGELAPSIGFRAQLPLANWNGRYLQAGCGGLCGNISLRIPGADGCPALNAGGFVIASTDMGHRGMDGSFGRDLQKRDDFAYRGVHLTALAVKSLISAYYGRSATHSYFSGCSDGGREALIEAQRFPDDFDGILAGAPAMNFQVQNSLYHAWQARSNTDAQGKAILLAGRLPILHAAVLKACDAIDGQRDGLLATPSRCIFDPATVECRAAQDAATCLTPAEVAVVRKLYAGPRDPRTGERLTQGGPQYGSELAWGGVFVPFKAGQGIFSARIAMDSAGLIFADSPPASLAGIDFNRATFNRLRDRHPLYDATDPDLARFARRGGKLILWHGWSDPHISPLNTVAYYDAVRRRAGPAATDRSVRLYLLPGVDHCGGGEGPSAVDFLTPMIEWVESGTPPEAVVVGPPRPKPVGGGPPPGMGPPLGFDEPRGSPRSRPVYPYPYVAAFVGRGDVNAAASYRKGRAVRVSVPAWAGSEFYRPYLGRTD